MASRYVVSVTVNGEPRTAQVPARMSLADCLREEWGLTGCHVGCEQGACGACTVLLDGRPVRSCLMLAVQASGAQVTTIEGLADGERLHPVQEAFWECHGLQCGFCTPGMVLTVVHLLEQVPAPTETQIRRALSGNLCMCTGYQNIVRAVGWAAARAAE
ncbi:MAG: (2Fe-2S)-binding protein [Candidatus Rokubacteria bacterium]|nr:(2Fe-2S)-binding protein [Candidatus Rokubacteria bacterium]MBI3108952.1 (2Fe-2S)-binding protein [Candidatus Rokubacteria bacterium]